MEAKFFAVDNFVIRGLIYMRCETSSKKARYQDERMTHEKDKMEEGTGV